jgi:IS605 OrfB family transposase
VKLTLQTQLLPSKEQAYGLRQTIERFNEAANWLAQEAFERKTANKFHLQKLYYPELRERFALPAQFAVRCISQVSEAFKRDKTIKPKFRKHSAMPLDYHLMSFKGLDRVSIKTLNERVIVPFVMGAYQQERFGYAKGQCDLVFRKDGKWFLLVTVDLPENAPVPTTDFLGVDLGVINLATDSDGKQHSGKEVEAVRLRYHSQRQSLQREGNQQKNGGKRPLNVRRKLKRISKRESRFRRDVNHQISKQLVVLAKDTSRNVALENLKGIRDRSNQFRKPQRTQIAGWSFFQLRQFIEYKARLSGVEVVAVDPRNTSRTCSACGHCEKANRKSQSEFVCKVCHFSINADWNAAINIAFRASVIKPKVSEQRTAA